MTHSPGHLQSAAKAQDCSYWMQALTQAWKMGEWSQCLRLAQKITSEFPEEGLAWKLLGSLYQQQDNLAEAAQAFLQASKCLKKDAEVLYNLANVFAQLEEYTPAIKYYRQTLKLNPAFSQAYANWASVLKQSGQLKEAEKVLRRGLNIHQQDGRVNFELATLLHEADKPLEAIQYYREAVEIEPDNAVIFFNMAVALEQLGNMSEAIDAFQQTIALQSDYVEAYSHLGALYLQHGDTEEAEQWLLAGLALAPAELSLLKNLAKLYRVTQRMREYQSYIDQIMQKQEFSAEALNNLATEMFNQHLYAEAEAYCLKALEADPENPYVQANLGLIENARNAFDKACQHFDKALEQLPECESVLSNYGISLRMLGRYTEAIAKLEEALRIHPEFMPGYINLANVYLDMGQIDTTIKTLQKALEIEPDHMMALRNVLFANSYSNTLPLNESLDYAHRLGAAMMKDVTPYDRWPVHAQDQRLRIGLVSADLRKHPVGYFLHQWLQTFDASRLEIYGYSTDGREDAFSHELKDLCNQWRSLAGLTDAQAAKHIRADGIHILLDLSGLSGGTRLPLFAYKPAPVQATWLGYWGTTGLPVMDYVIGDPVSIDAQVAAQFTEQVVNLPHTRMCFTAPPVEIEVNALPALSTGAVTFGCFQNYSKVSDEVLSCWGEILQAMPTARLFWQTKAFSDHLICEQTLARLAKHGIAATRCTLYGMVPRDEYLRNHHQIDVILDTFPFTGGTTTCEALWMGVPTVTLIGETLIARQGASYMHCVGLQDWVATTRDEYVHKAIAFASDLEGLATLRAQLRQQVLASPLMNAKQFAQDFEQLLSGLWQQTLATLKPQQLLAEAAIQDAFTGDQPVWVVSATRMTETAFWRDSALGRSLKRHMQQDARLVPVVAYENTRGLSEVFNHAIAAAPENALLVLIHDDVWLDENTFVQTIQRGLTHYDVIGVAGNARIQTGQPGWCFVDTQFTWDDAKYLRGAVSHGQHAFGPASSYGDASGECQLMDGVFLAAHKQTLLQSGVRFDQQFEFHFYDLDFCRTATRAGLKLGVWPVRMTHQSGGAFGSARWRETYLSYYHKWEGQTAASSITTPSAQALQDSMAEVFDQASTAQQQGDLTSAKQLYQEILAVDPQHALAMHNLGLVEWQTGQQTTAIAHFAKAYALEPAQWQLLSSYLTALHAHNELTTLEQVVAKAMRNDQHVQALQALMQDWQIASPETAPDAHPSNQQQEAVLKLFEQQAYAKMEQALQALLQDYPAWLGGWKMLADVLMIQKKDARHAAREALALNPDNAQEHCYYGLVLKAQTDLHEAAAAFRKAIALKPDYAAAYNNLGIVLKDLGEVNAAIQQFEQALAIQPQYADCFSNMLFCMTHAEGIDTHLLYQAHVAYADRYEAPLKALWQPHANPRTTNRPLNIGWVSADFRAHSVAHFLLPLLPELAADQGLRLIAYANQPLVDAVTQEMQGHFAEWHEISALTDQALADKLRADQIDILIDLSGHTSGNRLLTFARKPAPIQISWLGYLNTTGLSSMDYYLADPYLLPVGKFDDQFSEKLVQLPVNATFTPYEAAPSVNALPALSNGYITFGCFNRVAKMTKAAVQQWASLMHAMPASRMMIGGVGTEESTAHLQTWFTEAGIATDRLSFYSRTDMQNYLAYYHEVDICLDTFPSNGVTTTAHALWMGVPTLCIEGDRLASRGAMALMQHLNLPMFVVERSEQWLSQAQAICQDLSSLAKLRASLRQRFSSSLLANPALQAQALSTAFRGMWQRWCDHQPSTTISLNISQPRVLAQAVNPTELTMRVEETIFADVTEPAREMSLNTPSPESDPLNDVLEAAKSLQAQGAFEQASALYHEILTFQPQHAEANYQLGFIQAHVDCVENAIPLFEKAVMAAPMQEQYWVSYIDALILLKDFTTASEAISYGLNFGLSATYAQTLQNEMEQVIVDAATPRTEGPGSTVVMPIASVEATALKFNAACLLPEVSIEIPPIPVFGRPCPNPHVAHTYRLIHPAVYQAQVPHYAFIGGAAFPLVDHSCVVHQYFSTDIWETREQSRGLCEIYPQNQLIVYKQIEVAELQDDSVIALLGNGSDNYAHWLTEYLPQIVLLKNAGVDLSQYKVLIDAHSYPAMEEGLNLLGIDSANIQRTKRETMSRYASARWVSPVANVAFQRPKALHGKADQFLSEAHHAVFHPDALRAVRSAFLPKVDQSLFAHLPEKIFIKRVPGRDTNMRLMINESALEALMIANGFTVVEPGAWNFIQQVTLFSQAKYIVSASGAALVNMMWAPEGANIVVLMNDTPYANYWYFANIATAFGHHLSYVLGEALQSEKCSDLHHANFAIDSHALLQCLVSMGLQDIVDPSEQPHEVVQRVMAYVATEAANLNQNVRLLKELIELQLDNAEVHYQLATTLVKLADRATALKHFEKAARLASAREDYWLGWIGCLLHMQEYATAQAAIDTCLEAGIPPACIENLRQQVSKQLKQGVNQSKPLHEHALLSEASDETTAFVPVKTIVTLIPAYKSTYIEPLLFALATQTYRDFKVVISDDSPDDAVSQKVHQLRQNHQYRHLNIEVVAGPGQGGFVNIYNLVRTYAAHADLFHILMDDDLIFPTFYETHIRAHQKRFANLSISGRWYATEQGQPYLQAMDHATSQKFTQDFSAREIAKQLIPKCNNKLGEWSHAVFRASAAEIILQPEMAGISYFGLDDIGSFIKAAIAVPAIWIPESLGIFRISAEQNTGKLNNATIKCAHYSWISLALAALKNEWISAEEAWKAIHLITGSVRNSYASDAFGIEYLKATNGMTHEYHPDFETRFLTVWQAYLESLQLDKILNGALDIKLL